MFLALTFFALMNNPVRMIAVDIDGTLLDSNHQLPARNQAALTAAHAAGIEVVLVTGRRYPFALPVAAQLPFEHTIISCNGAVIRTRGGITHAVHLLPREVAAEVLGSITPWRGYALLAYDIDVEGQIVIESLENRGEQFMNWYRRVQDQVRFGRLEDSLTRDPLQVMFSGPLAPLREVVAALDAAPFRGSFHLTKTFYEHRDLGMVDLIHRDCSKGAGLREWAEHQKVPRETIMAVGDNFNDYEMLEYAGIPVVMGNAVPELKTGGWRVTLDNDAAGLAVAVEQWALRGN